MSLEEYRMQAKQTTGEALNKLMLFIIENLQMSVKEKEEQLKLYQKHHNDLFLRQFPNGQLWKEIALLNCFQMEVSK